MQGSCAVCLFYWEHLIGQKKGFGWRGKVKGRIRHQKIQIIIWIDCFFLSLYFSGVMLSLSKA